MSGRGGFSWATETDRQSKEVGRTTSRQVYSTSHTGAHISKLLWCLPFLLFLSILCVKKKKIFVEVNYAVGRKKRFSEVHNTHKISEEVRSSTWGCFVDGRGDFFFSQY